MSENIDERNLQKAAAGQRRNLRLLFLITSNKLANKAELMFEEGHVSMVYRCHGQGTASNEMMDMLGLSDTDKSIIICALPKMLADEMLKKLRKQLRLGLANTGIAFTVPISGANSRMVKLVKQLESEENSDNNKNLGRSEDKMEESLYSLIMVLVDRGYSEEVMEAARTKGAGGGSVINTRWVGSGEEAMRFWGFSVQTEREIVLILAQKDQRKDIMKAIGDSCGAQSEAHGVVLSLPVDGVAGLD